MSETKVPIWQTAWLSWRDVWRVMRTMPLLAAIFAVLIGLENTLDDFLAPGESEGFVVWRALSRLALIVPFALFTAPVLLAFYRYLLLGEMSPRYALDLSSPRLRTFFGYHAAFRALVLAGFIFGETSGTLGILAAFGWLTVLTVFTTLLFPAVAVDAPGAGLVNAARDVRPLLALVIGIVVLLPFAVAVFMFAFGNFWYVQPLVTPDFAWLPYLFILVLAGVLLETVSAAVSARLYRAWAQRLGRPAEIAE